MIKDITKAYSEVYEILQLLDKVYVNKIPQKFLNLIEKEKDINYIPNIRPNIPLENQYLLEDTINILAMLKIDYWCSDENEKLELIKLFNDNERIYQDTLRQKYNADNLFKNIESLTSAKEASLVEVKSEKWYEKFWAFFKNLKKKINSFYSQ